MANNTLLASDSFVSGSLAAGWSTWPNASGFPPQIVAGSPNVAAAHAIGTAGGVIWTGLTWPTDQISEVTVQSLTLNDNSAQTNIQLFVRVNGAGTAGYEGLISSGVTLANVAIENYATGAVYKSASNITVSAGDVFTLQAAGCCITLYQNGIPLLAVADATVPSGGSPGFAVNCKTATALAHAQVASWRGYSCVQQDGIWQKQGVVLAPNATDLASGGQGLFGGTFINDINPQLIGGTTCYKTWFSGGTPGAQGTFYAESPDLINWTRRGTVVISGFTGAMIIKVGSTYYSYSQAQASAGTGNIALHTSSDGITWALISASVLSPGGVGAWDQTGFYPLRPITVIAGTWYALTIGSSSTVNVGQFKIGLATSPDGQTWTKYVGNPVLSGGAFTAVFPLQAWTQVGSTYYMWFAVGPSAAQQASGQDIFQVPGETARYSTTDFITWSGPVRSIHRTDMYEGLNQPTGATPNNPGSGLNPCAVFTVGSQTYAIGQAENLDGSAGGDQFALAIAPAPLSALVLQPEDACVQVATDGFTNGVGPLSGNWTTLSGLTALAVVSGNKCEPSVQTSASCAAAYTGTAFSTSHYSEITIAALGATTNLACPLVCGATGTGNHYRLQFTGATGTQSYSAKVVRRIAGSEVSLGPVVGITPTVGDVIRLSVIQTANGPVLTAFQNGATLIQYVDQSATALLTGNPGVLQAEPGVAGSQVSLWAGGNAGVIPSYMSIGGFIAGPWAVTPTNAAGFSLSLTSPTFAGRQQQPTPVCFCDPNGNEYVTSGATSGSEIGGPLPIVYCDNIGRPIVTPFTISSGSGSITVSSSLTGNKLGQPTPVVAATNAGFLVSSAHTVGTLIEQPIAIVLCDSNGNALTLSAA